MKRLNEVLNNQFETHLYPFFWQKGQSNETNTEYIKKMSEQGIRAFCVESRPHPDFLGDTWWNTMDHIIAEAKKRNMRIWILDDDRFPTGHAHGKVPDALKRKYLNAHFFDICSNGEEMDLDVSHPCGIRGMMDPRHANDQIFACVAARKNTEKKNTVYEDEWIDLTENVRENTLTLKLSEGNWTVALFYITSVSERKGVEEYLDPMCKESTEILLHETYQKHFDHYKEEFGKTIQGFFSDEPAFYNTNNRTDIIGHKDMPLPWNGQVWEALQKQGFKRTDLLALYRGESIHASQYRWKYMNTVTGLYKENFTDLIGNWCRSHGVMYMGHVIEDDNAHARLGVGPGHYFRAVDGEDMAGIDIIGGQVVPGMDYHHDAFSSGGSDGEFYHYALVRMGASCAKLDPKKKGRLMCEAFGAYGWTEGLKTMKWITDHMISHGVNWIVPHAFDPKKFPDMDCPPHFYVHGNNPQYPYFHVWSAYADRLCHLFSGGIKETKIGILYHAFAEWSGKTMMFQKPAKVLQQNQIDSDIISEDLLLQAELKPNIFQINHCTYNALIVPGCEHLPASLIEKINELAAHVHVYAIDQKPESLKVPVVSLAELPKKMKDLTLVHVENYEPHLVAYQYAQKDGKVWMFTNEDILHSIDTWVTIDDNTHYMIYDAMHNQTYKLPASYDPNLHFHLHLNPYESLVLVPGTSKVNKPAGGKVVYSVSDKMDISLQGYNENKAVLISRTSIGNLASAYPHFSGKIHYSFEMQIDDPNLIMEIPEASEIVQVSVNDIDCGTLICPDYMFDLSNVLRKGKNKIEITVINNLERALRDPFSMYLPIEPLGIIKPILFLQKV